MTEIEQINTKTYGELPNESWAKFTVYCEEPENKLAKVKEVISIVSRFDREAWPTDDEWAKMLPQWFLAAIKRNTVDMVMKNPILWDYGSWLDALKYREWEWFSSKVSNDTFEINVIFKAIPYSINPLEYVIFETGVPKDSIHFIEVVT